LIFFFNDCFARAARAEVLGEFHLVINALYREFALTLPPIACKIQ
jgi:hypothetical protein